MYLEATCTSISLPEWERLMHGARKASYKNLLRIIKRDIPDLFRDLALEFPNPYAPQCKQTATHYILVHSAIEYFIHK